MIYLRFMFNYATTLRSLIWVTTSRLSLIILIIYKHLNAVLLFQESFYSNLHTRYGEKF